MGPIGGPAPTRTGRHTVGRNVTWNWSCIIALQIRPVLLSERVPYMKNKESNCHSNKCNIWSPAPSGARHQAELADWLSVVMWLRLQLQESSLNRVSTHLMSTVISIQLSDPLTWLSRNMGANELSPGHVYMIHDNVLSIALYMAVTITFYSNYSTWSLIMIREIIIE
jgi:hypothetical protein